MYQGQGAQLYDSFSTGLMGEQDFYIETAQQYQGPVLELGCGTGRITIPIARKGLPVIGMDLSQDMLAFAAKKLTSLEDTYKKNLLFINGDMRKFNLHREAQELFGSDKFKLIIIPYRSFLHLLTTEDQKSCLRCAYEHLAHNGRLVLNFFDPRLDIILRYLDMVGPGLQKQGEFINPATGKRVLAWLTAVYSPDRQLIELENIFEEIDIDGRIESRYVFPMKMRWIYRFEMEHLLENCGFAIESLAGGFHNEPFAYGKEQVWTARKTG